MDNSYLDLWTKSTETWVKIDKSNLPWNLRDAKLSDIIVDNEDTTLEESSLLYLYYLMLRWPPYSNSEESDILNKFKGELKQVYTRKGLSEVMAIKDILNQKREALKKDLSKTPDEFEFKTLTQSLESLMTLFDKKLELIEKLEMAYAINGELKLFDTNYYTLVEENLIQVVIKLVSKSISDHPNAKTSKHTIELFLKTHIDFKKRSFEEKREKAIERCIEEKLGDHIEEQLTGLYRNAATNWIDQLDDKVDEIEKLLPFFAQKNNLK